MKLTSELKYRLAGEYVLGTLTGRARARLSGIAQHDVELRTAIKTWEIRLVPLTALIPEVKPPKRVWQMIERRLSATAPAEKPWRRRPWYSVTFWQGFAAAGIALMLAFAVNLSLRPSAEAPISMMAVLSDDQANPAVVVAWPPQQSERDRYVKIKVQAHPQMAAETSWELWMILGGKERPVSLGLVGVEPDQTIRLSAATSQVIGKAWGLAISIEPKGGSPTGQPTGPVILKGPCVKVL